MATLRLQLARHTLPASDTAMLVGSPPLLLASTPVVLPAAHAAQHGTGNHVTRSSVVAQAGMLVAATVDSSGLATAVEVASSSLVLCGPTAPPRTVTPPYTQQSLTRRLTVPTHCLAVGGKARTRRRIGGGGVSDEEVGGGDDGGSWGGGGDDWWHGSDGDPFGDDDSDAYQPQPCDVLLAWTVFCTLAFASTCQHLASPSRPASDGAALAAGLASCSSSSGGAYMLIKSQLAAAFA